MINKYSGIYGIGVDIVKTSRFTRLLSKYPLDQSVSPNFYQLAGKFMHPTESTILEKKIQNKTTENNIHAYISGVWSIKEAIYKALCSYVPHDSFQFPAQNIYTTLFYKINNQETGAPQIEFDDNFANQSIKHSQFYHQYIIDANLKALLSISHDGDYTVAYSCLVKETK